MFEVNLSRQADRLYSRLNQLTRERMDSLLERFEQGQFHHANVRALRGRYLGSMRYRLGKWRIVFRVDHSRQVVWIEAITTRGEAYR